MRHLKNTLLVACTILLIACSGNKEKSGNYEISGKLSNGVGGESLYFEELSPEGKIILDSTKLNESGEFVFKTKNLAIGFYRVKVDESNFAMLVIDSTQKVMITGNIKDLGNTAKVEGSPDTKLFLDFNNLAKSFQVRIDSLQQAFQMKMASIKMDSTKMDSLSNVFEPIYNKLMDENMNQVAIIVMANPTSLACLAGIQQLNPEKYLDVYIALDKGLYGKHPGSKYIQRFHEEVTSISKLAIGSASPEIALATPDGQQLSLSSLKGNVVLVDFWASWCGPCRKENPNVVKLYKKYHSKGFEILGVSLDQSKDKWVEAIKQDGLEWKHVSDLRGWESSVCPVFGINSIPFTLLVDKEGKILAKGLRGAALANRLKEIFGS